MLAAAMNPCPCGFHGDTHRPCVCTPATVQHYLSRVSGPLLDRIDIHLEVPAVRFRELTDSRPESRARRSAPGGGGAERAAGAVPESARRARQRAHDPRDIRACCRLTEAADALLRTAIARLGLSARRITARSDRAHHRDLAGARRSSRARQRGGAVPRPGPGRADRATAGRRLTCGICNERHTRLLRTTLNIDDALLAEASRLTGITEKTALVRAALEELVRREVAKRLIALGGTMPDAKARRPSSSDFTNRP